MHKKTVLIAASSYKEKFYTNPQFIKIPNTVIKELQILCINTAEKLRCIICIGFYPTGNVYLEAITDGSDTSHNESYTTQIIDNLLEDHKDLFQKLELWYKIFMLKEEII